MTGVFAQQSIIGLSYPVGAQNVPIGGMLDGNYHQIVVQIYAILSVTAWSFVVTYGILYLMNCFPGLHLRLQDHEEELGTDMAQMGETAYGFLPLMHSHRGGPDEESMDGLRAKGEDSANAGIETPSSSSSSTPTATNVSTTTLNLDLHEPRSDEDEDRPRRLPEMTEQGRNLTRLSQPRRHGYTEDDSESDHSESGR